jgi:hypothetical protein
VARSAADDNVAADPVPAAPEPGQLDGAGSHGEFERAFAVTPMPSLAVDLLFRGFRHCGPFFASAQAASISLIIVWLDDAELTEFLRDLACVVQPRLANGPEPGRKRRILGSVLLAGQEPTVPA